VGVKVFLKETTEAANIDYFDYDLVCVGCPSLQWHPPKQVTTFLLKKFEHTKSKKKLGEPHQRFPEKTR